MSNGNGNGSSGDPTPASSAIALLPRHACGQPSVAWLLRFFALSWRVGARMLVCTWHLGDGAAAFAPARRLIVALLKRKAENPVAARSSVN
jgi:hypothetical protein